LANNKEIRLEGESGTKPISIGGYGAFSIDAPSITSGRFIINDAGNVGIGTATQSTKLDVRGAITLGNDVWHNSTDGINRLWYATNGCTYFHSGNTGGSEGFAFRNTAQTDIVTITDNGNINASGSISNNQFSISKFNQLF